MITPRPVWYCWGCGAERPGWHRTRYGCGEATVTSTAYPEGVTAAQILNDLMEDG
jgi:hypothetical protein